MLMRPAVGIGFAPKLQLILPVHLANHGSHHCWMRFMKNPQPVQGAIIEVFWCFLVIFFSPVFTPMHRVQGPALILHQMWRANPAIVKDAGFYRCHFQFAGVGFLTRMLIFVKNTGKIVRFDKNGFWAGYAQSEFRRDTNHGRHDNADNLPKNVCN